MSARRRHAPSAVLGLMAIVLLLGASPCSPDYPASRNCPTLSMQVTIGQPGVLVPDCLGTSPMQITFPETISYPALPPSLAPSLVNKQFGRQILITPTAVATPGVATLVIHTTAGGRAGPSTYTVAVTIVGTLPPDAGPPSGDRCPRTPPPTPGSPFVTATATPAIVATNGTVQLSEVIANGTGPFTYAWRGYSNAGDSYAGAFASSDPASNPTLASPLVPFLIPEEDSYFFVEVTDHGVPATDANHVMTGCVRVHASDGPVARFSANPLSFPAGTSVVTLDPSGSTGYQPPVDWFVEYFADVQPAPATLEDFLRLGAFGWSLAFQGQSDAGLVVPADVFARPGVYRAQLQVTSVAGISGHSSFDFLQVLQGPPDAGAPDAGAPDAGPPPATPVLQLTTGGDVVPGNGSISLGCSVTNGGVGPFTYAWHGYRDDGAPGPGPFSLSPETGTPVTATLFFPTDDFYFFCVATDNGVALSDPNRTSSGYVKVHESDGPVGRFTLSAASFRSNVDDITADASGSTGVTSEFTWTVEQYIGTRTPAPGIRGVPRAVRGGGGRLVGGLHDRLGRADRHPSSRRSLAHPRDLSHPSGCVRFSLQQPQQLPVLHHPAVAKGRGTHVVTATRRSARHCRRVSACAGRR